jgi:hypothetical protein
VARSAFRRLSDSAVRPSGGAEFCGALPPPSEMLAYFGPRNAASLALPPLPPGVM